VVPEKDEELPMIRLRRSAASARQALRIAMAVTVGFAVLAGGGTTVLACPMCFGAEESRMIDGTKLGMFVLIGITLVMQGAFAGFFFYLRRRAKLMADADLDSEWSKLQKVSR
jgi:hypothetical protein